MRVPGSPAVHACMVLLVVLMMAFALYMQYGQGLSPCPLCMSQRMVVVVLGLISLVTLFVRPAARGLRVSGLFLLFFSACGIALAIRQLYLESLPPSEHHVCMPGLDYLIQILPWQEILRQMLTGGADCAVVAWRFLGLSMAGWTLVIFVITALTGFFEMIRKHPVCTAG